MMKFTSKIIVVLTLLLAFVACKKDLEGETVVYAGYWISGPGVIQIYEDGRIFYNYQSSGLTESIEGRVVIKDGKMKMKAGLKTKTVNIDQAPTFDQCTDSTEYEYMILDSETYFRDDLNPCED
jgi:hypothetical protein